MTLKPFPLSLHSSIGQLSTSDYSFICRSDYTTTSLSRESLNGKKRKRDALDLGLFGHAARFSWKNEREREIFFSLPLKRNNSRGYFVDWTLVYNAHNGGMRALELGFRCREWRLISFVWWLLCEVALDAYTKSSFTLYWKTFSKTLWSWESQVT